VITGIVVALTEELVTLTAKKLEKWGVTQLGDSIIIIYAGAGSENAAAAANMLVKQGATKLISWGCAAGLASNIKPGVLIVADRCVCADKLVVKPDKSWLQHTFDVLADQKPQSGAIAESDKVVITHQDKLELGIARDAIALDMESAAIARVAKANRLPFLVIRAIADPQAMDLPQAVVNALDGDGQVILIKLLGYLLLHPGEIPRLIKLGCHFKAAKDSLKQAALKIDKIANFAVSTEPTAQSS
jgi:adenosylhomocysteine nucleosidase